jgi:hypothetical protein
VLTSTPLLPRSPEPVPVPMLVTVLAGMPELYQRLLGQHAPDPSNRCRECFCLWPCLLYRLAAHALQLHTHPRSGRHAARNDI